MQHHCPRGGIEGVIDMHKREFNYTLLTSREAAIQLNLSPDTVNALARSRKLRGMKVGSAMALQEKGCHPSEEAPGQRSRSGLEAVLKRPSAASFSVCGEAGNPPVSRACGVCGAPTASCRDRPDIHRILRDRGHLTEIGGCPRSFRIELDAAYDRISCISIRIIHLQGLRFRRQGCR